MNFRQFFQEAEEEDKNVQAMLKKLPAAHRALLNGFKFKYLGGNTLNGDDEHIGVIDKDKITVAAPWNYGREFTTLHEIAHMIYEKMCSKPWKEAWSQAVKKHPDRQKQNDEELWCMAYANHFAKHKNLTHHHPAWEAYMNKFCKETGSGEHHHEDED
jgi:hypothetical protein